jgi:uncharacterized membrane protein YfcA
VTHALVFGAVFASVLMQTLTGFGSAMVAMALLPYWIGLLVAAPLVALIAATLEAVVLLYWRDALDLRAIKHLSVGTVLGVPVGVLALRQVDAAILLPVLGAIIVAYALYGLMQWRLPRLEASRWAYGAGWMAGVLGGAYNVTGPPVIVYGHCRRWSPAEFKANLQAFFILADVLVIAGHAAAGNLTRTVWENYLLSLPAIALGVACGLALERFIRPDAFRRTALVLLIALGAKLLF